MRGELVGAEYDCVSIFSGCREVEVASLEGLENTIASPAITTASSLRRQNL